MRTSPPRLALAVVASVAVMAIGVGVVEITAGGGSSDTPTTKSAPPAANGTITEIDIADFAFSPTPAKVAAGSTVEIVNKDAAEHTVTSGTRDDTGKDFDVDVDGSGTGELLIMEPGTYEYICRIHPGMKGTIEVVP
ncbi:hypothetical protein BH10ACT3_BH10ACT3_21960 [soil metagenome]